MPMYPGIPGYIGPAAYMPGGPVAKGPAIEGPAVIISWGSATHENNMKIASNKKNN